MLRTFLRSEDNNPDIIFKCREDLIEAIPHPVAASKMLPEWYKKLGRDVEGGDKSSVGTIKRCIPVLDAMSQGYIIPLWADLHIKINDAYILYDKDDNIIDVVKQMSESPEDAVGMEHSSGVTVARVKKTDEPYIWCKFPDQFDPHGGGDLSNHSWQQMGELCDLKKFTLGKVLMKFHNPWTIETKKGWSVYFKNPANNWSNDIHLLEGVVDTDTYKTKVNFPYIWTGSTIGEWIIPKGTPLVQVIPFKRKRLKFQMGFTDHFTEAKINAKLASVMFDKYRRLFWHKGKD